MTAPLRLTRKQSAWSAGIKALLLVLGVVGQIATYGGSSFMSSKLPLFYTNQSNWAIMLIAAVLLVYDVLRLCRGERAPVPPNWLQIVRYAGTVAIALTFVVFSLMLTPQMIMQGKAGYLTSLSNLCVHNLVPLLALLDFFLFGYVIDAKRGTFLWCAVMPLYYTAFALIVSTTGDAPFGPDMKVPYFFFDYVKNGWLRVSADGLGVVWWFLILCAAVLAMGYGIMAAARRVRFRAESCESARG